MTPKEKAKELVDKFYPRATSYSLDRKNQNENAKECALICVNEILQAYPHTYDIEKESTKAGEDITIIMNIRSNITYWNEVKEEIEKL